MHDLTAHQVATLAATQAAARALLTRLAPAPLESDAPSGGIMPGAREKALWAAYKKLGVQELKDLEEAVAWVGAKGWLDPTRVGLQGHSYGGYITAYALTHSKVFSAGIAGAPVTDWALYDTIYTERYMGLPKDNKAGYEASSVVKAAANLHGRLLLIHGMIDDNVHLQNSAQLISGFQRADKDFEVMVYPGSRHGIAGGKHYQRLMFEFVFKTMGVKSGGRE